VDQFLGNPHLNQKYDSPTGAITGVKSREWIIICKNYYILMLLSTESSEAFHVGGAMLRYLILKEYMSDIRICQRQR
jgi:hypothetical protein